MSGGLCSVTKGASFPVPGMVFQNEGNYQHSPEMVDLLKAVCLRKESKGRGEGTTGNICFSLGCEGNGARWSSLASLDSLS